MTHSQYDGIYKKGDEDNETEISAYLSYRWKCKMVKQGHYDKFDYIAVRDNKITAFVEIRCRTHNFGKFDDCFMSLTKKIRADELTKSTGLPCFFVVSWDDNLGYVNLNQTFELTRSGKKWNRRDNPEISELLCKIPTKAFTKL